LSFLGRPVTVAGRGVGGGAGWWVGEQGANRRVHDLAAMGNQHAGGDLVGRVRGQLAVLDQVGADGKLAAPITVTPLSVTTV
jgi:hypothetical protein